MQPAFNGLVPFQGYNSIKQAFNGGNSHYNSLQAELHGQVTRDLTLQFAYTLSRAIDPSTGSGGNGWDLDDVTNPYQGWKYDVGPSVLDRTHVAFVNFVYNIPLLKNSTNRACEDTRGRMAGVWDRLHGVRRAAITSASTPTTFPASSPAAMPATDRI